MSNEHYIADAPLASREGDRLRRWPFAERIADTLATRSDPASLVVGVYGRWGEGKTTVLQFIEQRLEEEHADSVVVVRFNPWLFTSDKDLFLGFFAQVAAALDRQLESTKGKIGEFLKAYGGIVAGLSGVDLSKLGEELVKESLEERRERLEGALAEKQTRIVVLLDDIDRLDKDEVQAVFRLLKVAADFHWTSYVLAFDPEIIAAALAERYPGRPEGGDEFLDKIVQVPLTVPPVPRVVLRDITIEGIERVLRDAGVQMSDAEGQRYVAALDRWILEQLDTLRDVKRYINSIEFALPLVKEKVDLADFMLIEAFRVFRPTLYELIANNGEVFVHGIHAPAADAYEAVTKKVDKHDEKDIAALLVLFPMIYEPPRWPNRSHRDLRDAELEWTRQKRITSRTHFEHYFSAGAPAELPNEKVADLVALWMEEPTCTDDILELLPAMNPEQPAAEWPDEERLLAERLAEKLERMSFDKKGNDAACLARALLRVGHRFPHSEGGLAELASPRGRLATLTCALIEESGRAMALELKTLFEREVDPTFALHVYRRFKANTAAMGPEAEGNTGALREELELKLTEALALAFVDNPEWLPRMFTPKQLADFPQGRDAVKAHAKRELLESPTYPLHDLLVTDGTPEVTAASSGEPDA